MLLKIWICVGAIVCYTDILEQVHCSQPGKPLLRASETDRSEVLDSGVQNVSAGEPASRSVSPQTQKSAWMPYLLSTMKKSLNYLGNAKQFGFGSPYGGEQALTPIVYLLAMVAIVSFLLFLVQQPQMHQRKRRMSRRLRGNPFPYSYTLPTSWRERQAGKYLSSDSRPIIMPGPLPTGIPGASVDNDEEFEDQYSGQKAKTKGKMRQKLKGSFTGTNYRVETDADEYVHPSENEKLTKEEIMYILKSLED